MMIITGNIAAFAIVVCCILWAGYFLLYGKKAGTLTENDKEIQEKHESIVGVSKTRLGQYTDSSTRDSADKRGMILPDEMEQIFYTKEEARLNIDVDLEPLQPSNNEMDEEDLFLFEDTEPVPVLATGASFDDLSEMSEAIQSHLHELSQAHIVKAAKSIRRVNGTNLLKQLVSQVKDGEQKVADILDRCEEELIKSARQESEKDDMGGFDLERYL
jgi:hypothetical protein